MKLVTPRERSGGFERRQREDGEVERRLAGGIAVERAGSDTGDAETADERAMIAAYAS